MRHLLRSTTALVVSASLALPHAAWAQGEADPDLERKELQQQQDDAAAAEQLRLEEELKAQEREDRKAEKKEERKAAKKEERKAAKKEERREERKAERRAERQAERAAQAQAEAEAAAAASADAQADAEVVEETVTDSDVRRSDQEFSTSAAPAAAPTAAPEKDKGLSDAGKIALLGLGALAVGQLLKNGDKVVANSGDRVVVQGDDGMRVLKNDDVLLRQPGAQVRTERFNDGSTRTHVLYPDGSRVVTIRSANGRVLQRSKIMPDGREYVLFDDTRDIPSVQVADLPQVSRKSVDYSDSISRDDLQRALLATRPQGVDRHFSLAQIRDIDAVRKLVPEIDVANITFDTGSAAIRPNQAQQLAALGGAMRQAIQSDPTNVFLIEGHTDAVGDEGYNLALSDRRAETVALALSEYFDVPPANLVVQGYGEYDLKVPTVTAERANRRVAVRRITPLLR